MKTGISAADPTGETNRAGAHTKRSKNSAEKLCYFYKLLLQFSEIVSIMAIDSATIGSTDFDGFTGGPYGYYEDWLE